MTNIHALKSFNLQIFLELLLLAKNQKNRRKIFFPTIGKYNVKAHFLTKFCKFCILDVDLFHFCDRGPRIMFNLHKSSLASKVQNPTILVQFQNTKSSKLKPQRIKATLLIICPSFEIYRQILQITSYLSFIHGKMAEALYIESMIQTCLGVVSFIIPFGE